MVIISMKSILAVLVLPDMVGLLIWEYLTSYWIN